MAKRNDSRRHEAALKAENERLKRELWARGAIDIWGAEDLPSELENQFLRQILAFEQLPEEMDELRTDDGAVWHVDIFGGCSLEDIRLHLKYDADEEQRRAWAREWPDDDVPPHEDPPYDRDRHLPGSGW